MHLTIPLKGSTAGRQYAGWDAAHRRDAGPGQPGVGRAARPGRRRRHAERGRLHTRRRSGRYPAVVSFAAYNTETHTAGLPTGTNEAGSPPVFTDRGYCPVIVERRGMGRSTGEQAVSSSPQDVDDHEKVIAWAAEQPWCNGEVVLFGTSYYGDDPGVGRRPQARPRSRRSSPTRSDTDSYRHSSCSSAAYPAASSSRVWMGANYTAKQTTTTGSPRTRGRCCQPPDERAAAPAAGEGSCTATSTARSRAS